MVQLKFKQIEERISQEKINQFNLCTKKIFKDLQKKTKDKIVFKNIINGTILKTQDTGLFESPEDFTIENVILRFFKFLDFEKDDYIKSTCSPDKSDQKEADYSIFVRNKKILFEAEPLNKDLTGKGCGINQLENYLNKKSFDSDLGITTNGFEWVLIKYNSESFSFDIIKKIDLSPIFKKYAGQEQINDDFVQTIEEFYRTFGKKTILDSIDYLSNCLIIEKETITRKFYDDYIKLVFGFDKKGNKKYQCLLDSISFPLGFNENQKRLFAITIMNRLIFIKFLEDRILENQDLISSLFNEYKTTKNPMDTFYKSKLQHLFYDVLNTEPNERKSQIKSINLFRNIPYLNGGLFRDIIDREKECDVDNEILELIINEILKRYSFTLNGGRNSLNPDILGYVFEKTINYLTGSGENNLRKAKGAYYTPDAITTFICRNTIDSSVLERIKDVLSQEKYKQSEIEHYVTIDDFFADPPKRELILQKIYYEIDKIKILDPACGSGHFLTSALKQLIYIKTKLLELCNQNHDLYHIKKSIITNNLFGVDVESSAVEIAKLRLWLSLIEDLDVSNTNQIDTLPNIDYNIICGNSLVGWLKEEITQDSVDSPIDKNIEIIFSTLDIVYHDDIRKKELFLESKELITTYNKNYISNLKKAYSILKTLYKMEEGSKAVKIKYILDIIRDSIYSMVSPSFYYNINEKFREKHGKPNELSEKIKLITPFHWNIDFSEVIDNGGFDIIIGNPPYGIKISDEERIFIDETLASTKRFVRSELAFIEKATFLSKNGGYIGLIVPKALTFSQKWIVGRELIKDNLRAIADVSEAFKDVKLEQVIIILKNSSFSDKYCIKSIKNPDTNEMDKSYIELTDTILLHPIGKSLKIFEKINKPQLFLKSVSNTTRGLPLQSAIIQKPSNFPVYRGAHIHQYCLEDSSEFLSDELKDTENDKIIALQKSKILSQRIVAHITQPYYHLKIMSVVDKRGVLSVDTVENTFLIDNENFSLEFIACLFNSNFVSWYAYHFIFSDAIRGMDFDNYYVGKIPLPSIPVNNQLFKELYDEIEKLKNKLKNSDLSERVQKAMTESIQSLKLKINREIYRIYDLADDEIALIEQGYVNLNNFY
ncbi:MAG: DNA methyltransferase [Methanoregulaceae archaeon]|jgi:hypothetical protein